MPAVRDEGICLRHWDWSETSQTVSLFGRGLGVIRGLAKGARRERGSFGGGIDLLTRGAFGAIRRSGTELAILTEWDLVETYPALRERLARNRAAFYAADLVQRMVPPHDPHPELYDELVLFLRTLGAASRDPVESPADSGDLENVDVATALLRFQWRLLEESGFQPSLDADGSDGPGDSVWFDPHGGAFSGAKPMHGWRVRRTTLALLRTMAQPSSAPSAPIRAALTAEAIDRANRLLAAYIRETLQAEPATLHDLFGNLGVPSIRSAPRSI